MHALVASRVADDDLGRRALAEMADAGVDVGLADFVEIWRPPPRRAFPWTTPAN